jgi:hypothetical protein
MPDILPPAPVDAPFGAYNWVDWYRKVRDAINNAETVSWNIIIDKPTTLAGYGITNGQVSTEKNAANGYAGLNAASRTTKGVDTTDDVIIDLATKGLVLKDTQGTPHYWRVTISTLGVLTTTDLGTTKP